MTAEILPTYAYADVAFERGEGCYLYDTDDRRFLDFGAGIAVSALGHCHPHLVETLQAQAAKLWHTSNLYHIPPQERLAARLVAASFADKVFFCNSGAEAIEAGLKMVRRYHHHKGQPERYRMITFDGCFHGRTLATIAAAGGEKLTGGFGPMLDAYDRVPFGDVDAVKAAVGPETAGILVEPIQGEGGIRPAPSGFLAALREIADANGLLLMYDEVQCGMGRTGKLYAHEWSGVTPDVMASAKGIGGGFPLGACLATEEAASGMTPGSHGTTYGGNALATSVGNAVLDVVLEDGFLERVVQVANHFRQQLAMLADRHGGVVAEVRGEGLMLGIKTVPPCGEVIDCLRDRGLLSVPAADNVIRLLPPLIIDETQVGEAVEIMESAFAEFDT